MKVWLRKCNSYVNKILFFCSLNYKVCLRQSVLITMWMRSRVVVVCMNTEHTRHTHNKQSNTFLHLLQKTCPVGKKGNVKWKEGMLFCQKCMSPIYDLTARNNYLPIFISNSNKMVVVIVWVTHCWKDMMTPTRRKIRWSHTKNAILITLNILFVLRIENQLKIPILCSIQCTCSPVNFYINTGYSARHYIGCSAHRQVKKIDLCEKDENFLYVWLWWNKQAKNTKCYFCWQSCWWTHTSSIKNKRF